MSANQKAYIGTASIVIMYCESPEQMLPRMQAYTGPNLLATVTDTRGSVADVSVLRCTGEV